MDHEISENGDVLKNDRDPIFQKLQKSLASKLAIIGVLIALLFIPTIFIKNLITERSERSASVSDELKKTWGPIKYLSGPVIAFPRNEWAIDKRYDIYIPIFLEHRSGRRIHWDRLAEIVARMDRQIGLMREISELRKAVPTPFSPLGFLQLLTTDYLFPGQPEAIEYLEALRDELAEMVKAGKGAVPKERFRLMTFFLPPMYLMGFLDRIAAEHGAVSVTEPFFTFWGEGHLDPSKPLESVARKSYMIPEMRMYGPLDNRAIDSIKKCAKDYKVDGAIYWADVGCRHTCAMIKLFKDVLEEIDIPVVTIDCDVVDPTITSEAEVRGKLEQFFEMLEDR